MKRHAPATSRNREPIAAVLEEELPESGLVLEIASGTGEHAAYFAWRFPALDWQPSDVDPSALSSIIARHAEYSGDNLRYPIVLDAGRPETWEVSRVDAIICINMVHISPWEATEGLFAACGEALGNSQNVAAPLIIYGPFLEAGTRTAPSNLEFDQSLRARNPDWGLRKVEDIDELAAREGLARTRREEMPANNLMLVYRCI
ncbi:DUF938 domain-containing protein [Erythrobacter sp. THAF29]|uniref:DUF938 domain-containing protein n=1 Tax=Erythrobacter sp. THAF29 TaxID=2587851 RepID=UPI00126848FD|nr:DUF938 domain-containing protein [Erythrobacter sp. THAF29]QFT77181.1 hypothetical protein FIU90_06470 [Erythrobacter sp. THAF29]